ncbi:MAG: glycosyl transferase, partial [Pseudomonadota bacterium]
MADFHQNGIVTTLHNLTDRPVEELEKELVKAALSRPIGLVLPSLFSELEGPALANILDHIEQIPYLTEIVIGLDRADEGQYRHALGYFGRLPQHHRVLWQDGPRLREIDRMLSERGLAPQEEGKGRNVWYCYGYMLGTRRSEAIALHDCDVVTYDRGLLARLVYPIANPTLSYEFCKGYYARVGNGKINGRVTRLLVTPLIRALKAICGPSEYLDFLDSFRYPLAGEFSIRRDVLLDLRIPSDWGLEVGVLSEMCRNYSTNRICQVDIADLYDHKHQELSIDDKTRGLSRMSLDICKSIFRKLATQGHTFTAERFRTIKATYYRIALDFVDSYRNDALINGLAFDQHKEELAVEVF